MMEHTTDRLFWTLSAIIVAALLLTLSVKAFPKATQQAIAPMTGLMKQADKATAGININVGNIESGDNTSDSATNPSNNDNANNMGGVTNSTGPDDGLIGQVQQQNDQSTRANMSLANYQVQLNTATSQISSLQQQLQAIQNNPTNSSVSAQAITDLSSRLQALNAKVSSNQDTFQNQINQVMQSSNDKTSAIQSILQTLQNNQANNATNITSNSNTLTNLQNSVNQNNTNLQNSINQTNNNLNNAIQYQSVINPGTDLNTIKNQGVYSISGNYPNLQNAVWGKLIVYNDQKNNQENIQRIITTNSGDMYMNVSDWWGNTPFKRILNQDDFQSVMSKGRTLDGNDDIDQITAPGIYAINGGNPPKNSPNNYGNWAVLTVGTTINGTRMDTWTDWQGNVYTRYFDMNEHPWFRTLTTNDLNNINNEISQMQAQIATLQSHDVYNITPINDSTDLSKLKTPGTYTYSVGNGNSKGIWNLTGADNMGDALSGLDNSGGFDNNYATIIVSPSLGTWQTQTLIGANGITMIRSMNNGQDFNASIDSRCQWHIVSGNDQSTMMYRGDVSNGDLNNLTETGMYSTHGVAKNAPNSWDWDSTIEVINNKNGLIIQRDTMQDSDSHTPNQQRMFQRLCINGTWQGWTQINSDIQSKVITNSDNILDTFYMPDGSYHVEGAFTNTPFGFSGYGTLVKKTLGNPNSWPDISLTLYDSDGAVYTNQYGFNTWQGWKNSNAQVTTIPSGADLNNYTTTGIYQSYNVQVNNSPYSSTLWFQLSVQQGAAFTTQTLTSSWGQVWTRTLSGSPQSWNGWTQTSNGH